MSENTPTFAAQIPQHAYQLQTFPTWLNGRVDVSLCFNADALPWICTQTCDGSDQPLDGANAHLEELKENLYQKEREITELLRAERRGPLVPQPHCSTLLPAVIHKVLRNK